MALGLIPDNGTTSDGSVRFSDTFTFDYDRTDGITGGAFDFFGIVAHEFTEVMGRELNAAGNLVAFGPGDHPLDLFKFSAPGVREFVGTNAGYFSIDGGATNLNNFNAFTNGDFGDWAASAGNDSFLAFSPSGVVNFVSLTDLQVMDVIGWQVAETAPAVAALTSTVGEDGPPFSQGLLIGASDADNDILFEQNLDTSVTTVSTSALAQTLFLGSDYTLSGSTISLTSTGFTKFNGLSLGEHDTATFNYGVSDGITTTPNTLTLTINGLNDDPSAAAIAGSVSEDGPAVTLLADFTDPDRDDTHSFSIDTTGTKGRVTNNNDGTFSYDPNGQFDSLGLGQTATDTFAYTVADNHGASSTATATVTINGLPDEPVSLPSITLSKSVEILDLHDHKEHHHGRHGKGDDHDDGINANVAYTFEVRNTSTAPADAGLKLLSLIDDNGTPDKPADDFNVAVLPKAFIGGDFDRDGLLDVGEVWTFRFKDTVQLKPGTEIVNTAVARARDADGNLAASVDQATIITDDVLIHHKGRSGDQTECGASIQDFNPDSTIELAHTKVTSADYSNGVLTLFDKHRDAAQLDIVGDFTTEQFAIANYDGNAFITLHPSASVSADHGADGGDTLNVDRQVAQLVSAMATHSAGSSGFDRMTTPTQTQDESSLQGTLAPAWHS